MLSTLVARPTVSFFTTPLTRSFRSTTTSLAMTKKVLVPIANGSEEIETTCIQDILVRFGADVTVASVNAGGDLLCKMSRGLFVQAHTSIAEAAKNGPYDLIVLPGGVQGAEGLRDSVDLHTLLKQQAADRRLTGAVCAAPALVLATHDLIPAGARATSFPKFRDMLKDAASDDRVVDAADDHNLITSQGPGTAMEFALALGEKLFGKEKRDEISQQLLHKE